MANSKDYPQPKPGVKYLRPYLQGQAQDDRVMHHEAFFEAATLFMFADQASSVMLDDSFGIISTSATDFRAPLG